MAEVRKLAAILASDIVGYSRMAGADEDRTLAWVRALRSDPMSSNFRFPGYSFVYFVSLD
jgi:class 3 adenylate cyclase